MLRVAPFLTALALLAACGGSGETTKTDPCDRLVCKAGQECIDGKCQFREPPEFSCLSNSDCVGKAGGPLCDLATGECVECTEDANCPEGSTCVDRICDDGKCKSNDDCSAPTGLCRDDGACVECKGVGDCFAGEVCSAGTCQPDVIECSTDLQCKDADPGRPRCKTEEAGRRCVECLGRADCAQGQDCEADACVSFACGAGDDCSAFPGRPHCDASKLCVECLVVTDCGNNEVCTAGACVPEPGCTGDGDCTGDPDGSLCDEASGKCMVCVTSADCAAGNTCNDEHSACVPTVCTEREDCPPGFVCPAGTCAAGPGCNSDDQCNFNPRATRCDGTSCVGCLDGGDCARGESCVQRQCTDATECNEDVDCGGAYVCVNHDCVACRNNLACPRGACVDGFCGDRETCLGNGDCAIGSCIKGVCAECAGDLDCRPGLWCQSGSCLEGPACGSSADCGPDRVCSGGSCAAQRCVDDDREPDNTLPLARPMSGTGLIAGTLCPNDDDWHVFYAVAGVGFEASFSTAPPGTDISLFWYDAAGVLQASTPLAGKIRVRNLPPAQQSRYYLRVRGAGSGAYFLVSQITPAGLACPDPFEPNDTRMTPVAITTGVFLRGLTLCGDQDWFSFSAAAGVPVRVFMFPHGDADIGSVFSNSGSTVGSVPTAVPFLGGGKQAAATDVAKLAGNYMVRVTGTTGTYDLFVAIGDDEACGNAPALVDGGSNRARVLGTTLGHDADEPAGACGAGGPDALYTVTLDADARLLATVGADHDARLSLLASACGAEQSCAPFTQGRGAIDVPRLAAGTYTLVVGGTSSAAGPYDLAVRLLPTVAAPANDRCGGAQVLDVSGGSASVSGSTVGASAQLDPSCSTPVPDVYYAFTLPGPQRVILDVTADAPVYAVLTDAASCLGEVACAAPSATVHLDKVLPAGDHAIVIGSATGGATTFRLDVNVPPTVVNETCATAAALVIPSSLDADTTYAENDLDFGDDLSCTNFFTYGSDVFYRVNAAAGQTIDITVTPAATYDASVYVLGDCGAPVCLDGADAGFAGVVENLKFVAPSAGTYRIAVDGADGGGTFKIGVK